MDQEQTQQQDPRVLLLELISAYADAWKVDNKRLLTITQRDIHAFLQKYQIVALPPLPENRGECDPPEANGKPAAPEAAMQR